MKELAENRYPRKFPTPIILKRDIVNTRYFCQEMMDINKGKKDPGFYTNDVVKRIHKY